MSTISLGFLKTVQRPNDLVQGFHETRIGLLSQVTYTAGKYGMKPMQSTMSVVLHRDLFEYSVATKFALQFPCIECVKCVTEANTCYGCLWSYPKDLRKWSLLSFTPMAMPSSRMPTLSHEIIAPRYTALQLWWVSSVLWLNQLILYGSQSVMCVGHKVVHLISYIFVNRVCLILFTMCISFYAEMCPKYTLCITYIMDKFMNKEFHFVIPYKFRIDYNGVLQ